MRRLAGAVGAAMLVLPAGTASAQDHAHSPFAERVHVLFSAYVDAKIQVVLDLPLDDGAEGTRCRAQILQWSDRSRGYEDHVQMYLNLDELIPDPASRETLRAYFAPRAEGLPALRILAHHDVREACEARSDYLTAFNIMADRYDAMIEAMQAAPE